MNVWAALWYPTLVLLGYSVWRAFRKHPIEDERKRKALRWLGIACLAAAIALYAQNNPNFRSAYYVVAGIGLSFMIMTMQIAERKPQPQGKKRKRS